MALPRFLAPLLTVVLLGAGGYYAYQRFAVAEAPKIEYRTQPAERARLTATVTASGTLSPVKTVAVGSQVSGRIVELFADFNSEVKKGDVIARIDPSLFQSDLMKTKASYKSSQAAVTRAIADRENARINLERAKQLFADKVAPQAEVDAADAAYKVAKASVESAQAAQAVSKAAIDTADVNLLYTTILSPIDGVVISRDVSVGQTVAASLSAPQLFSIAEDLKAMEVHTNVAESDVGALKQDMKVRFTVDAYPNERFFGTVAQIRNSPLTLQNVVTYDAVVRVDNDALKLRPGMTASVTFIVDERRDALAVPNAALRFTPSDPKIAALAPKPEGGERSGKRGGKRGEDFGEAKAEDAKTETVDAKAEAADAKAEAKSDAKIEAKAADTKADAKPEESKAGDAKAEDAKAEAPADESKGERRRRRGQSSELNTNRTVWVLVDGQPKPVQVQIGISDGSMTEIVGGELTEGMQVIVGATGGETVTKAATGSPFNTMGGGGGRGGGGGGGGGRRGGF
ncbi:efflux RND transporter periplasmic adaptor subunit [Nannocystis sp. ILAH1]|uniref:efflux RND transporter periplasmic adaptor subunit n=1 Tax=unclassified Nannocystis TaxID=2627009 RepID=UPI00226E2DC5|nr:MULTISPECIES: efflux RND transporter periplasmic adaptor subunit [unclassified Nannocystis]MCY0994731.1 efflux RND transporter periplasmic adaptor subunit [Nannocystis sp. ILAH1]MCY1065398.1 efflux RND transporter periplasmic adaptor subunit [Nannocystis sp. RBIL2]